MLRHVTVESARFLIVLIVNYCGGITISTGHKESFPFTGSETLKYNCMQKLKRWEMYFHLFLLTSAVCNYICRGKPCTCQCLVNRPLHSDNASRLHLNLSKKKRKSLWAQTQPREVSNIGKHVSKLHQVYVTCVYVACLNKGCLFSYLSMSLSQNISDAASGICFNSQHCQNRSLYFHSIALWIELNSACVTCLWPQSRGRAKSLL